MSYTGPEKHHRADPSNGQLASKTQLKDGSYQPKWTVDWGKLHTEILYSRRLAADIKWVTNIP